VHHQHCLLIDVLDRNEPHRSSRHRSQIAAASAASFLLRLT
jgi:hypothetical protein